VLIGLLLGIVIGLLVGPLFRSWLAWREYSHASREARLHEEVMRRMSRSTGVGPEPDQVRAGPDDLRR
jgi:uncharacterized protein YneF (UPF0154 family)